MRASASTGVRLALCCGLLLSGCGGADFPETSSHLEQPVINGDTSPAEQNAVVVVRNTRIGDWGTGVLVAPKLVLTSKRLLFQLTNEAMSFYCNQDSSGTPTLRVRDADDFEVWFGETFPMRDTASGVRIHAGAILDLCGSDVALLEIDEEFPIEPLPMRLTAPPSIGEYGTLVGWGMSDESTMVPPGSSVTPMGRRHQAELQIETVGPSVFPIPNGGTLGVLDWTFVTGEGGCFGDAGAPFLSSKTRAIIGTFSSLEPEDPTLGDALNPFHCFRGYTTFRSLEPERGWITEAFQEAGAAVWFEGLAKPAEVGSACTADEECTSGHCLMARSSGFCSTRCDNEPCAQGQRCLIVDNEPWCVPERLESAETSSSACSASFGRHKDRAPNPFPFVALLLARCRLRSSKRKRE